MKHARTAWAVALVPFTLLIVSACDSMREEVGALPAEYEKIGEEAPGGRCYDSPSEVLPIFPRCKGYLKKQFVDVTTEKDHADLIKFLKAQGRWHTQSIAGKRKPANGNPDMSTWPTHEIQAIKNPGKLRFKAVPSQGTILGRITVSPGSEPDAYYGLKDDPDFERTYYIVSEPYSPESSENTDRPIGERWRISKWYLLGVRGRGNSARVEKLPQTGFVSWCKHGHTAKAVLEDAARFLPCDGPIVLQAIRQNESTMATLRLFARSDSALLVRPPSDTASWIIDVGQRLLSVPLVPNVPSVTLTPEVRALLLPLLQLDPFTDPVWMTCGVGCCIAETIQ